MLADKFSTDFGKNVRRLRQAKGLSQEALAGMAALHPTHISLIESGKRVVRLTTIRQLALALRVQPEELMPKIKIPPGNTRHPSFSKPR